MYTYVHSYRLFIVDIIALKYILPATNKQVNRMAVLSHPATDMHGQTDQHTNHPTDRPTDQPSIRRTGGSSGSFPSNNSLRFQHILVSAILY